MNNEDTGFRPSFASVAIATIITLATFAVACGKVSACLGWMFE